MVDYIAVIGLGYVGLPLAVEFGKTKSVVGFDINSSRINELMRGSDSTQEVSKQSLQKAKNLIFTDKKEDLLQCNIFIVTVPTPIDKANRPDLSYLIEASVTVGKCIKENDVIIYESTVYPGCTEEICVPVLEKNSHLKLNKGFFVGYSPERINPGDKVNTLTKIKKITSGSNPKAADRIDDLYNSVIRAGTWKASSIKVAEAAKVIENSQRDLSIAFVNELSLIFDRMGIDTLEVLEAAGSKWNFLPFRPGLVGGHCIGIDPFYLTHKAEELGYHPQVVLAGRHINENMASYVVHKIIKLMLSCDVDVSKATVGVLGITFKENCPDTRNSKVVDLVHELSSWNVEVLVSDPWADDLEVLHNHQIKLVSIEMLKDLDALVVAVGHNEFRALEPSQLLRLCKKKSPILIDIKSIYNRKEIEALGFILFRL